MSPDPTNYLKDLKLSRLPLWYAYYCHYNDMKQSLTVNNRWHKSSDSKKTPLMFNRQELHFDVYIAIWHNRKLNERSSTFGNGQNARANVIVDVLHIKSNSNRTLTHMKMGHTQTNPFLIQSKSVIKCQRFGVCNAEILRTVVNSPLQPLTHRLSGFHPLLIHNCEVKS